MKFHETGRTLKTSGTFETNRAGMLLTGQAFEILSSGIYTNKIRAVIREILCNAWDAEISMDSKNPRPKLKLPNLLDPTLVIEDRGPGMSHETVMQTYLTYFASTKQGSNDEIGGFGLGSKSPLSYVDMFEVESKYDGVKRNYTIYVDENKMPCVALTTEIPMTSDEHTGVKVSIPVKTQDIHRFCDEASEVVKAFRRHKPEVTGNGRFKNVDFDILIESPEGFLLLNNTNDYLIRGTLYALCGNVLYKVPLETLDIDGNKISGTLSRHHDLVLKFGIGEVQPAPSRETLDLKTSKTKNNLIQRARGFNQNLAKYLESQIDAKKSLWEQLQEAPKLDKLLDTFYNIENVFKCSSQITRDLKSLKDRSITVDLRPWNASKDLRTVSLYGQNSREISGRVTKPDTDRMVIGNGHDSILTPSYIDRVIWVPTEDRFWWRRLKTLVEQKGGNETFLVVQCPENLKDKVFKTIGSPPKIEEIKDLEPWTDPRVISIRSGRKAKVNKITNGGTEEVEVDLSEGVYYYVPMSHWEYKSDFFSFKLSHPEKDKRISLFVNKVYTEFLGLTVEKTLRGSGTKIISPNVIPCYVIPKTLQNKVTSKGARNLMEHIETLIKKNIKLWSRRYKRYMYINSLHSNVQNDYLSIKQFIPIDVIDTKYFKELLSKLKEWHEIIEFLKTQTHYNLWGTCLQRPTLGTITLGKSAQWSPLSRYPMFKSLSYIPSHKLSTIQFNEIREYIKAMNSWNSKNSTT